MAEQSNQENGWQVPLWLLPLLSESLFCSSLIKGMQGRAKKPYRLFQPKVCADGVHILLYLPCPALPFTLPGRCIGVLILVSLTQIYLLLHLLCSMITLEFWLHVNKWSLLSDCRVRLSWFHILRITFNSHMILRNHLTSLCLCKIQ